MTAYTGPKIVTQEGDHFILKKLIANLTSTAGTTTLGRLPAGAIVRKVEVGIRTGFNGSPATINVGNASSTGAYMGTAAITEASAGNYVAYPNVTVGSSAINATITLANTSGTTGAATVVLSYTD